MLRPQGILQRGFIERQLWQRVRRRVGKQYSDERAKFGCCWLLLLAEF